MTLSGMKSRMMRFYDKYGMYPKVIHMNPADVEKYIDMLFKLDRRSFGIDIRHENCEFNGVPIIRDPRIKIGKMEFFSFGQK